MRTKMILGASALGAAFLVAVGAALLLHSGPKAARREAVRPRRSASRRPHTRPAPLPTAREQRLALARLVDLGYPVYCAGGRKRYVALTFDDGPGAYTPIAMQILRRARARTTFFLVGKVMQWFPGWPRKEASLAALGDHTWNHPWLPGLSPSAVGRELANTKRAITLASGQPVRLFRPPYGVRSPAASRAARRLGLVQVIWSVDSLDWAGATPRQILRNVTSGLRPGAIVLMHENRGQTLKALKAILRRVKRRHLRAVTVPELLAADPPSIGQLRQGLGGCPASAATTRSGG